MSEQMMPTTTPENGAPATQERRRVAPPVDIFEYDNGLAVVADVPGAASDAIDIRVENGTLTIKAQGSDELPGDALGQEYGVTDYYRQFELSRDIDAEKIQADYKHGVLTIRLPLAAKAQPKRITVSAS